MKVVLASTEFAQAVFTHLSRIRERSPSPKTPWGQDWESFLETIRFTTAEQENEARRIAVALASDGLLTLKLRRDGERIQRFTVPLESERQWFGAFGRIHPADTPDERIDLKTIAWVPQLRFLGHTRVNVMAEELLKLNAFLCNGPKARVTVPIKERSLQIFGDEKRLDALLTSALFRPGRLDLLAHLRCETIGVPLAWKRGPAAASAKPIIAIENAATWHSYCRWNEGGNFFSAVVYGDGNRFVDGVRYLSDIFAELGGSRRILYFGDLDPQGVLIPYEASGRTHAAGLPAVEPHLWSYRQLLTLGVGRGKPWEGEPASEFLYGWLGDTAEPVRQLFAAGQRLAQEHIGWEFLRDKRCVDSLNMS
ncbi:MAG: Wadjet anti-phage system protein JetD domain-containing protein [Limisphaerales bacterium]